MIFASTATGLELTVRRHDLREHCHRTPSVHNMSADQLRRQAHRKSLQRLQSASNRIVDTSRNRLKSSSVTSTRQHRDTARADALPNPNAPLPVHSPLTNKLATSSSNRTATSWFERISSQSSIAAHCSQVLHYLYSQQIRRRQTQSARNSPFALKPPSDNDTKRAAATP